jgi:hypothetical protein
VSPSKPTQKLDHPVGVTEQITAGCVQLAETVVYVPPVTA